MNWLDTATKEILQKDSEPKLAPPKAAEFALVLLRNGTDRARFIRAIRRINESTEPEAEKLARMPVPLTINPGLTEEEAVFGQFELVCCDAVAAFIRSEVLLDQREEVYLRRLYQAVLKSAEFKPTRIHIMQVPANEEGERFVDQFLGIQVAGQKRRVSRFSVWVPYKKARIMKHWAARLGAEAACPALDNSPEKEEGA